MPRVTKEEAKAYRVVIVTERNNNPHPYSATFEPGIRKTSYFGPHMSIVQARQIKTRELRALGSNKYYNIVDAYVERADNWNRVLDTDKV